MLSKITFALPAFARLISVTFKSNIKQILPQSPSL